MSNRSLKDWALLLSLVAMWGSAFMFIKIAVVAIPPATIAAGRLVVGALALAVIVYARGTRIAPPNGAWMPWLVLALVGNAVPFYLIAWGQQTIESALAGILIAIMPLATLVLAHRFVRGEKATGSRIGGYVLGFLGIVLLMGPAALSGIMGSAERVIAQLAVLGGALCYAANSVYARLRVKGGDVLVSSAGVLLIASAVMLPVALVVDRPWTLSPSLPSLAAVVWLGVGATAIPTICYFALISSAGPTFMSLVNYLSPCVAVILGVTMMGEHPGPEAYAGLALILFGIAVSQYRRR
jgi:drug/metabolite transporter (DMT)-like permease